MAITSTIVNTIGKGGELREGTLSGTSASIPLPAGKWLLAVSAKLAGYKPTSMSISIGGLQIAYVDVESSSDDLLSRAEFSGVVVVTSTGTVNVACQKSTLTKYTAVSIKP
ncbi:hypothetical protein [Corynebacterium lipophiloflavum]|uniref:hypothetical protein n=1 Tax=Corynebacterium lipophiloflavum TaxID=161889 RepID=UPI0012F803AD|nr:hypothetical protein [Corynebacterium lipophiloflavum]